MSQATGSEKLRRAVQSLGSADVPALAIDLERALLVDANVAGRRRWQLERRSLIDGIALDAAMPGLRKLRQLRRSRGPVAAPAPASIATLTFWPPTGAITATWKLVDAPASVGRDIVIVVQSNETSQDLPGEDLAQPVTLPLPAPPDDRIMQEIARMVRAAAAGDRGEGPLDEAAGAHTAATVAELSHELRTPLTSVIGFAEVMQSQLFGPIDNPKYRDYVAIIADSARHALALIEQAAPAGSRKPNELSQTAVDLVAVARKTVASMALAAEQAEVVLTAPARRRSVAVGMSETNLRQILFNLISNALNATPAGGHVAVNVATGKTRGLRLTVVDSGRGLPDAVLEQLRDESELQERGLNGIGPHGLGLGVTRALIQAHGGKLVVRKTGPSGTAIEVHLPSPIQEQRIG